VLGGGESGVSAALLAKEKGYEVWLSDKGSIQAAYQEELHAAAINFELGQHTEQEILRADLLIKSPGIPDTVPLLQKVRAASIPVIGEIEFASRYTDATLVGITGSNGKTTTTALTYHLLKAAGKSVAHGGNIGESFARLLLGEPVDIYVLELSSFQLESIENFRPHIAMLLNLSPDHLDRYEYKMELYAAAKFRIARNQQSGDYLLLHGTDAWLNKLLPGYDFQSHLLRIDPNQIQEDQLNVADYQFDRKRAQLLGPHNGMNALFAIQAALLLEADPASIQEGLNSFRAQPHRMEELAEIKGVRYFNDSKATNVDAVYYALKALPAPIIWIAGGQDKGNDYTPLRELVRDKVQALVCLGLDNSALMEAFAGSVEEVVETRSAEAAVRAAAALSREGAVVLLSPACASFDLFKNYIHRGQQFRKAVEALKQDHTT